MHTLNGTGESFLPAGMYPDRCVACAIPRIMLALLETHQQRDGTVVLPDVLKRFMPGGKLRLEPKE